MLCGRYGENVNGGAYLWEDVPDCVGNATAPDGKGHGSNAFPSGK